MKNLVVLFAVATIVIFYSCKEGITNPIEPEAGRRDYIWTVDTLDKSSSFSVTSLWGVSENDLWIGGYSGSYSGEELQHFDGHSFERNKLYIPNIMSIWGLNENKIFAASEFANIYLFDGVSWKEEFKIPFVENINILFTNIFGTAKYNIYVSGSKIDYKVLKPNQFKIYGFIYKYNGLKWEEIFLSDIKTQHLKIIEYENRVFIKRITYKKNETQNQVISEYKDNKFIDIISDTTNKYFCNINLINNELLINKENNIYLYKNGKLNQFINLNNYAINFNETRFMGKIWGRSKNDLFFEMAGGISHYNGTDLQYIQKFSNTFTTPVQGLIFRDVVVFLIEDNINLKVYLLRGKLKE